MDHRVNSGIEIQFTLFTVCTHNSGGQHRPHTPSIHDGARRTQHADSAQVTHAATMTLMAPEEGGDEEVPAGATFDFRLLLQSKAMDLMMYDRFVCFMSVHLWMHLRPDTELCSDNMANVRYGDKV